MFGMRLNIVKTRIYAVFKSFKKNLPVYGKLVLTLASVAPYFDSVDMKNFFTFGFTFQHSLTFEY